MSRESRLAKNTAIIAVGNICTKGVSFLMLPLYTAILSAEEYGTVDIITTYTGLLTVVLTLQLEQGVFRFLVEARGNAQKQSNYISASLITATVLLVVFVTAGKLCLEKWQYAYTPLLLVNTVVGVINAIILQIPRGLGDNITYAAGSFISGSSVVILNVLFVAVLRWGPEGMLAANGLGMLIGTLFVAHKVGLRRFLIFKGIDKDCVRELFSYSLPLIPYTMCWWVIGASDRLVINYTIGVAYNGIYAVANKFPSLYNMASNIFQTAWMESAFETVDDKERNQYYNRMINIAVRFYSACSMGIIALMPFLFGFLVDPVFSDAYNYIPILLMASLLHSISALYGALYFAFKQTSKIMLPTILIAAVNSGINLLFIQKIGLYAAAGSTLIAYLILAVIRYVEMRGAAGIIVPKAFLLVEAVMYVIVLVGYYSDNKLLQMGVLAIVVVYCCLNNRVLLCSVVNQVKKILHRK